MANDRPSPMFPSPQGQQPELLLSAVLPLSRAEAVLTATLSAFVVYTCAVVWVFAVQDLRRAWLGMLLPAILCGGLGLLLSRGAA